MDESFSSLIFGIADHSVPDTSFHIPNYEENNNTGSNFHAFTQSIYNASNNPVPTPQSYNNCDIAANISAENSPYRDVAANLPKENSPYSSPNMSTEESENENDPFSQHCRIPVPGLVPMSRYHMWLETSFMYRRNERERQRVRNVNDGFSRLRNHLPRTAKMKRRQSKVETLQHAIKYIKHLQNLLEEKNDRDGSEQTFSTDFKV